MIPRSENADYAKKENKKKVVYRQLYIVFADVEHQKFKPRVLVMSW